ncbi:MAG: hypothetical protein QOE93_2238 [Actinomycetota bacterium]|jgi:hypothetical protein|nr:hypothetical protein [Actinomycetota bacterium]
MLEELALAIQRLRLPVDGPTLVQVLALRDQLNARIAEAVGEFDAHELWDIDGSVSMTAWLRSSASMTTRSASKLASMGRRLRQLPVTAAAYADGKLSEGKVEAILAQLNDATVAGFAEHEDDLIPFFEPLSVAGCARAMATWRAGVDEEPPGGEPERELHVSSTLDDRYVVEGTFDAEGGATIATAIRLATTEDDEVTRTPAARRGDALVDICRYFLDHQHHRAGGRHRPHLNVVVDIEALEEGRGGRIIDGPALDATSVSTMLCDSALHRVVTSGRSAILDYGTSTRTIPAPLWSALVIRDEHCRFPGCDRPSTWCEGHHVRWVTHGGPTELNNLVLLCSRHHHRLHEPDWQAKLCPDATFEVTDPRGIVHCTSPPRSDPPW